MCIFLCIFIKYSAKSDSLDTSKIKKKKLQHITCCHFEDNFRILLSEKLLSLQRKYSNSRVSQVIFAMDVC